MALRTIDEDPDNNKNGFLAVVVVWWWITRDRMVISVVFLNLIFNSPLRLTGAKKKQSQEDNTQNNTHIQS